MDFNRSRVGYYIDFGLVPLLIATVVRHVESWWLAPIGLMLWTLFEYASHRYVFHRLMRRQHWMHHLRPASYVSVPWYATLAAHAGLLITLANAGALGLFVGIELGYYIYIITHDRIHHGHPIEFKGWPNWLWRRARLHHIHHDGVEANFGVITSVWDKMFGTYRWP